VNTSSELAASHAEAARVRAFERHGAATIRALSGVHTAEYRASRLRVDGRSTPFASPHLSVDFADASFENTRGVVDSLGLRLRYSDQELHEELSPEGLFRKILFDVFEQIRCESLAPPELRGLRRNIDATFVNWCSASHGNGMVETEWGLWLYTAVHMVRTRLIGTIEDEIAEGIVERSRFEISGEIGHDLYVLRKLSGNQRAFAEPARRIVETFAKFVSTGEDADEEARIEARYSFMFPPGWTDSQIEGGVGGPGSGSVPGDSSDDQLESAGGYHIYTTEFDSEVAGAELYPADRRQRRRQELDEMVLAQAISAPRLGRELKLLFAQPEADGWLFGKDEGLIDGRLLSLLVSKPGYQEIFKQPQIQPYCDTVVSFLVDNSGSMKRLRYQAVAVLLDTFTRALSLAGAATEVLGFTTAAWTGGCAMTQWRSEGRPADPGRLGEVLHVVYKDADTPWRQSRGSMASLLETKHFREGIDGEALVWAYRRLLARPESRKYLVVISDGAPMDSATHNENRDGFLLDHLTHVAHHIQRQGLVRLGGVGIDLDLADIYPNSVSLDIEGSLSQASYGVLHQLFT
jgi:cobaltochelatase CobT